MMKIQIVGDSQTINQNTQLKVPAGSLTKGQKNALAQSGAIRNLRSLKPNSQVVIRAGELTDGQRAQVKKWAQSENVKFKLRDHKPSGKTQPKKPSTSLNAPRATGGRGRGTQGSVKIDKLEDLPTINASGYNIVNAMFAGVGAIVALAATTVGLLPFFGKQLRDRISDIAVIGISNHEKNFLQLVGLQKPLNKAVETPTSADIKFSSLLKPSFLASLVNDRFFYITRMGGFIERQDAFLVAAPATITSFEIYAIKQLSQIFKWAFTKDGTVRGTKDRTQTLATISPRTGVNQKVFLVLPKSGELVQLPEFKGVQDGSYLFTIAGDHAFIAMRGGKSIVKVSVMDLLRWNANQSETMHFETVYSCENDATLKSMTAASILLNEAMSYDESWKPGFTLVAQTVSGKGKQTKVFETWLSIGYDGSYEMIQKDVETDSNIELIALREDGLIAATPENGEPGEVVVFPVERVSRGSYEAFSEARNRKRPTRATMATQAAASA